MSDIKQSVFTKVLNTIKTNRYFTHKDMLVYGSAAAGGAAAYGLSGGDTPLSIAGGGVGFASGLAALGYRGNNFKHIAGEMALTGGFGAFAGAMDPNGDWKTWGLAGAGVGLGVSGLGKRIDFDILHSTEQQRAKYMTGENKRANYAVAALMFGPAPGMVAGAAYSMFTPEHDTLSSMTIGGKLGSLAALPIARYMK